MVDSIRVRKQLTPSTALKLFYPGAQAVGSGPVLDKSDNGINLSIGNGTSDGALWANAGYFTTAVTAGSTSCFGVISASAGPLSAFEFTSGVGLLLAFQINCSAPGSQINVLGNAQGGPGFRLAINTSGNLILRVIGATTANSSVPSSSPNVADAANHNCVVYFDSNTQKVWIFVDGVADAANTASGQTVTVAGSTSSPNYYAVGRPWDNASSQTVASSSQPSIAAKWGPHHVYCPTASISAATLAKIALWVHQNPRRPIPTSLIP